MQAKLKRVGDDMLLLLDQDLAAAHGLSEGSRVKVSVEDRAIRIDPLDDVPGDSQPNDPVPDAPAE